METKNIFITVCVPQAGNGLGTCHRFNSSVGCNRTMIDATTCKDPNTGFSYAHFCDFYDATTRSHCLAPHGKTRGGH